jgi:hypothetical protein
MSTNYRFENPVPFLEVRNHGIKGIEEVEIEEDEKDDPEKHFCLTDGTGFLHAYTGDGTDTCFVKYGLNDVRGILWALSGKFGNILSEHDDGYFDGGSGSRGETVLSIDDLRRLRRCDEGK